ncbi:MAG TPA: SDR family NAD(P)-dependent oxidoreductase [bacterium]|nr:SDR family NAD(P)-dependent oxidoreductase [bacterium]HQI49287.1 SDR family NAD(P)-dependent oxidoreductase [bacterium]HQJ64816.1 SDR family NAD(P)-dependent oxidoreductase [bacterium]
MHTLLNSLQPDFIYDHPCAMRLDHQTILLTGASSGIGIELARQLGHRGCRLILVARRSDQLRQLAAELPGGMDRHRFSSCDLANPQAVTALCAQLQDSGMTPDGLILNAGVSGGFAVTDMDPVRMRREFEINFWGAVQFITAFLPRLLAQQKGFIAVTSSLASYRGMPGAATYSASKAALNRFIESVRIDCQGHGVYLAVISPGFVRTPMTENSGYYKPFMIEAPSAARIILNGLEQEKYEIRFPWPMVLLAQLGRLLPERLYLRLMKNRRKPQITADRALDKVENPQ